MAWGMKKLDAIEKRTENNFEKVLCFWPRLLPNR